MNGGDNSCVGKDAGSLDKDSDDVDDFLIKDDRINALVARNQHLENENATLNQKLEEADDTMTRMASRLIKENENDKKRFAEETKQLRGELQDAHDQLQRIQLFQVNTIVSRFNQQLEAVVASRYCSKASADYNGDMFPSGVQDLMDEVSRLRSDLEREKIVLENLRIENIRVRNAVDDLKEGVDKMEDEWTSKLTKLSENMQGTEAKFEQAKLKEKEYQSKIIELQVALAEKTEKLLTVESEKNDLLQTLKELKRPE